MIILGHLNLITVGGHYLTEAAVVVSLRYRYTMISLANRFNYHLQLVFMFEYLFDHRFKSNNGHFVTALKGYAHWSGIISKPHGRA